MNFTTISLRGFLIASILAPMASPAFAATVVDTSLIVPSSGKAPNFALQQFASCNDMRDKVSDFMKLYYLKHPPYYWGRGGGMMYDTKMPMVMNEMAAPAVGAPIPS
jgi:hypothetical protein